MEILSSSCLCTVHILMFGRRFHSRTHLLDMLAIPAEEGMLFLHVSVLQDGLANVYPVFVPKDWTGSMSTDRQMRHYSCLATLSSIS